MKPGGSGHGRLWRRGLALAALAAGGCLAFALLALPPLAEKVVHRLLKSGDLALQEVHVSSVGFREAHLEGLTLARPGWLLQVPEFVARYRWGHLRQGRLLALHAERATLTLEVDDLLSEKAAFEGAFSREPGGDLPFDRLEVDRLDLIIVRKDGEERRLEGAVQLSARTPTETIRWEIKLNAGGTSLRLRGGGGLAETGNPVAVLEGSVADLGDWLAYATVPESLPGFRWADVETSPAAIEGSFGKDGKWSGTLRAETIRARETNRALELRDLRLQAKAGDEGEWTLTTDVNLAEGSWRDWQMAGGTAVVHRTAGGRFDGKIEGTRLWRGETFSALASLVFTGDAGDLRAEAAFDEPVVLKRPLEPFEATLERADGTTLWKASVPELTLGEGSRATLHEVDVEVMEDRFTVSAHQGGIPAPEEGSSSGMLPLTLTGERLGESWNVRLSVEASAAAPWEASWRDLHVSLAGMASVDWQIPNVTPAILQGTFATLGIRREQSQVELRDLNLTGEYAFPESQGTLTLRGQSAGKPFNGDFAVVREGEGWEFDYRFSGLQVPENTILGAAAPGLAQVSMAATVKGAGEGKVPDGGDERLHRLTLTLDDGRFHHLEKDWAGEGIRSEMVIESFSPFVTAPDQPASFQKWRLGKLQLTTGKLLYSLGGGGAMLKGLEAEGLDGRLKMEALQFQAEPREITCAVTFDSVELASLAALLAAFKGEVDGRVSGRVHLRWEEETLSLPKGTLALDPGSTAHLRMDAKEVLGARLADLTEDPKALQIVEAALKDLVVQELSIGFFDPEANESVCRIQLNGHSRREVVIPNTDGGKAIAPIRLNINVADPSELVKRLLNLGLREQFGPKKDPT